MFYRRFQNLFIALTAAALILLIPGFLHAEGPHTVYGKVQYAGGGYPGSISFSAYIQTRPGEVLTQSSDGCGYSSDTGFWWVQCSNFPTPWSQGDVLRISFNDGLGNTGSDSQTLTYNASDDAGTTTLSSPSVQITLTTSPPGMTVTADGSSYSSPHTFSWLPGSSHSISVSSPQSGGSGTRYLFQSWSDGGARTHAYTVPGSNETVTASFKTQHYLTVISAHGSPTGDGWYDAGASAAFGITTPESGGPGIRYVFTGWTGSGSGSYTGSNTSGTVVMNAPVTETANWASQYYLSTSVNPAAGGSVTPAAPGGWYSSGSTVSVNASTAGGYQFAGWSGHLSGTIRPQNITLDGPKQVVANFGKQVNITIQSSPAGRNFVVDGKTYSSAQIFTWIENSTHSLGAASPQSGGSGTRYLFQSWSDGGARTHSYTVPGSNQTVTASFKTQHYLTVTSAHGSPAGEGWYDAGTSAAFGITTPESGGSGIRYVFTGWTGTGTGAYTGSGASNSVVMNAPVTESAAWKTQYLLTLVSSHGSPAGSGYQDAGASVVVGVTSPESGGSGTRYLLDSWTGSGNGSYSGTSASFTVTMNNPVIETAHWNTQYYLSTSANPAAGGSITPAAPGGWYGSGNTVDVSAGPAGSYQWSGWSGDLSGTANPQTLTMNGPKRVTANFGKSVQITLATQPSGLSFIVDGTTCSETQTFSWLENETHTLSVVNPQNTETGSRYHFDSWSDGGAQTHTYTVPGSNATVTASMKLQHYVHINTEHGSVQGTGWYNHGQTAGFSVTSPEVSGGTRYVFDMWNGDYSGTGKTGSVFVNGPKTVHADWHKEYYLDLVSAYGSPKGSGWYTEGTPADFSVTTPDVRGSSRYIFVKFKGDYNSTGSSGSIVMNEGKSIQAEWRTEYYLYTSKNPNDGGSVTPAPPGKWCRAWDEVTLTASPNSAQNYIFSGWSGDVSGTQNSVTVTMDQSRYVTANFNFNGQIRVTTQPEGLTLIVDDVSYISPHDFTWPEGSKHQISVPALQSVDDQIQYRYASWSDGGNQTHEVTSSGISLFTACFDTYYYLDIQASPKAGGVISPAAPGKWIQKDTRETLEAVPNEKAGYQFGGWYGDYTSDVHSCEIMMDAPKTVEARFHLGSHSLSVISDPDGKGHVEISPEKTAYTHGETVKLTAVASGGNTFAYWSGMGNTTTEFDTLKLVMDQDYTLQAHFVILDESPPVLMHCFPSDGAKQVPVNTPVQFQIQDPSDGTGVDINSLFVSVNDVPVIVDGRNQSDGKVTILKNSGHYTVTYAPRHPFMSGRTIHVIVQCIDLAYPQNFMYKGIIFKTGAARVTQQSSFVVGPEGGTFHCPSTGVEIQFPEGAVPDTTAFTVSLSDSLPPHVQGDTSFGIRLHMGPEGYTFEDTVVIGIPYTQDDLLQAGVTDPMHLGVFHYSTKQGEWISLPAIDADASHIFVQISELCYFTLGEIRTVSDIMEQMPLPSAFDMLQNYPNPFNPVTTIEYSIPRMDHVSLVIYNMQGQKVRTLVREEQPPGVYRIVWRGTDASGARVGSGVYLFVLKYRNQSRHVKAIFMK